MNRAERLFEILPGDVEAVVVFNEGPPIVDLNFFYYTGLTGGLFEGSALVLARDGESVVIVPRLEEETARKKCIGAVNVFDDGAGFLKLIKSSLEGISKAGAGYGALSHRRYNWLKSRLDAVELTDISSEMNRVRLVKDADEVASIEKAAGIAAEVADRVPGMLFEGITEKELAAEIGYAMQKMGSGNPAFQTIAAFGASSAEPHYLGGEIGLKENSAVLCDFGATFDLYCSDITRTWFFGEPDDRWLRMYRTVQEALDLGMRTVGPGIPAADVHNKVAEFIDGTRFKGRFIHPLGHSLGLAPHDGGRLSSVSELILEPGMVFTVEPGIYLPGEGGVRLENDVVVTPDGCRNLTPASTGACRVEAL